MHRQPPGQPPEASQSKGCQQQQDGERPPSGPVARELVPLSLDPAGPLPGRQLRVVSLCWGCDGHRRVQSHQPSVSKCSQAAHRGRGQDRSQDAFLKEMPPRHTSEGRVLGLYSKHTDTHSSVGCWPGRGWVSCKTSRTGWSHGRRENHWGRPPALKPTVSTVPLEEKEQACAQVRSTGSL